MESGGGIQRDEANAACLRFLDRDTQTDRVVVYRHANGQRPRRHLGPTPHDCSRGHGQRRGRLQSGILAWDGHQAPVHDRVGHRGSDGCGDGKQGAFRGHYAA